MRIDARKRRGNVLVLTVVLAVVLFAVIVLAVDVGYVFNARGELQRAADAAAMAGAWELYDESVLRNRENMSAAVFRAKESAADFVAHNPVTKKTMALGANDVHVGYMANPLDRDDELDNSSVAHANTVQVRVRHDHVPLFFGRIFGYDHLGTEARATAALLTGFRGFRPPSDGSRLPILPITVDLPSWDELMDGLGEDKFAWNADAQTVVRGSDGILELNIFPEDTGSSGNRGTIDIGPAGNSTSHIADQIRNGISAHDINNYHGGELAFDDSGRLMLTGDTGISNSLKDDLSAVLGVPKIIPIFESVYNGGNNAAFEITRFVGVRIMYVKMTGENKQVIVQPANVVFRGGIPSSDGGWDDDDEGTTRQLYSRVWLVR